jgi:putative heme iron utilization protein
LDSICKDDFEGKTPFVTLRHGWGNIKTDLKAKGHVRMDWTPFVNMILKEKDHL